MDSKIGLVQQLKAWPIGKKKKVRLCWGPKYHNDVSKPKTIQMIEI